MKRILLAAVIGLFVIGCSKDESDPGVPANNGDGTVNTPADPPDETPDPVVDAPEGNVPCLDGMAGPYPCNGYDLLARLPLEKMEATSASDIWGWTDPMTNHEYALVGLDNGTAFVDITDSENIVFVAKLPTASVSSDWRDIKVYRDHAFIVSEAANHGLQVFDLTLLRSMQNLPVTINSYIGFTGFGSAHNIAINEDSGFAYVVGTERGGVYVGGPVFLDITNPENPLAAGGYGGSGYTHDAQAVIYNGPDPDHAGEEILLGANEDQIAIINVTDKDNPVLISSLNYSNLGYVHQGWLTEDQRFFILGDEADEIGFGFNSRTLVFDLGDLDNPILHTTYSGPTAAIDHNGYVKQDLFYLANYTAGLRLLDISQIEGKTLTELAYFDSYPANNRAGFNGVWSVYPYFESGKIVFSDINSGLFVVERSNAP